MTKTIAAIRIRGELHLRPDIRKSLEILRLHRVNHCVLLEDTPSNRGTLKVLEYYITYGEIGEETIENLLEKRGRLSGNKRLSKDFLKKHGFGSFKELAQQIAGGKAKIKDLGIKPVFRLHPPKKGFERQGIKRAFTVGGVLGYRADAMRDLVEKMI